MKTKYIISACIVLILVFIVWKKCGKKEQDTEIGGFAFVADSTTTTRSDSGARQTPVDYTEDPLYQNAYGRGYNDAVEGNDFESGNNESGYEDGYDDGLSEYMDGEEDEYDSEEYE